MKTQCPHCEKFYEVEEELAEEIVKCPGCKEEFFVEKYVEPEPRRIYKFLILKFEDVEDTINQFATDDWEVISHSTVFLSENSGGLWGVSAGTREEGLSIILSKIIMVR